MKYKEIFVDIKMVVVDFLCFIQLGFQLNLYVISMCILKLKFSWWFCYCCYEIFFI